MIMGPEVSLDSKLLALISDNAKVPIFSLSGSVSSSDEYPYFLQISQSTAVQFEAIATIVESFQWITVIFICEDIEYNPNVRSYLFEYFKQKRIQIDYICSLPSKASDHKIHEGLHKLMNMQTKIFVLHMTPSLASRFLSSVKKLGMMSKGYAWFLTDKTSNLLQYMNSEEVMKSLQGALALKPYVPPSTKLKKFTSRWKSYLKKYSYMNVKEPSVYGVWAYDAIWALARAVERIDTQIDPSSTGENSSELVFV